MTYYADMSKCWYFEPFRLIAVGWLSDQHPYAKGPVSPEFVDKLFDLIETIWDPANFRGFHNCEFCGRGNLEMISETGRHVSGIGHTNLFVPSGHPRWLFAAPSMILHYVLDHEYCPPKAFQKAVMACPRTREVEYFRTMEPLIPKEWHESVSMNGFRAALGWTLAREAGFFGIHELYRVTELAQRAGMKMNRGGDPHMPAPFPAWFDQNYIAPIRELAAKLDARGETSDANAVREWLENLAIMGDMVPAQHKDFVRALEMATQKRQRSPNF